MALFVVNRAVQRSFLPSREQMVALVWAIALAAFLSATGALDTDATNWGARSFYWTLIVGIGLVASRAGSGIVRRFKLQNLTMAAASVAGWLLPVTGCALAVCIAMFGGAWSIGRFIALVPTIGSMLVVLQLPLLLGTRRTSSDVRQSRREAGSLDHWLPAPYRTATLYALEAQDHYVQVYTSRGTVMVRKRFADAVASACASGPSGARTHRSWWIGQGAVLRLEKRRGRQTAVLVNGLRIPFSRGCSTPLGPEFFSAETNI